MDVIFDIDGVLSHAMWRVEKYLQKPLDDGTPRDWDAFFDAQKDDLPNYPIAWLANLIIRAAGNGGGGRVMLFTGRPERTREQTTEWLKDHVIPRGYRVTDFEGARSSPFLLPMLMRGDTDRRQDDVLKIGMLEKVRGVGYKPWLAFEDRPRIARAYRDAGLVVLQPQEAEF